MPYIRRLDHVIAEVADIHATHELLRQSGFPEAWPIGPFWPSALTSGIALGGINLELVEHETSKPDQDFVRTLVFEPNSPEETVRELSRRGISSHIVEKVEPAPELLRLRGFDETQALTPQQICTNVLIDGDFSIDTFFCAYTKFLRDRLSPDHPALQTDHGRVVRLIVELSPGGMDAWTALNLPQSVPIEIHAGTSQRVVFIRFEKSLSEAKKVALQTLGIRTD